MSQFKKARSPIGVVLSGAALLVLCGCGSVNYAARFRSYVKSARPDQRPKDWAHTLELMDRSAPRVGNIAPDFTLETYGGQRALTRSAAQGGRPQVLIFGSYT